MNQLKNINDTMIYHQLYFKPRVTKKNNTLKMHLYSELNE